MTRKITIAFLALALCALLLPATLMAKKQVERPMHLSGSGILSWTPEGTWKATESGQATHLGRYSLVESGTYHFTETYAVVFQGSGTCTAANGDQFNFEITVIVDEGGEETGLMKITGGTGRFAGASGSVALVSETNDVTGEYTISGTGTITY